MLSGFRSPCANDCVNSHAPILQKRKNSICMAYLLWICVSMYASKVLPSIQSIFSTGNSFSAQFFVSTNNSRSKYCTLIRYGDETYCSSSVIFEYRSARPSWSFMKHFTAYSLPFVLSFILKTTAKLPTDITGRSLSSSTGRRFTSLSKLSSAESMASTYSEIRG